MKTLTLSVADLLTTKLYLFIYALSFSVPLLLSHPQIVTGVIVNTLIFIAAAKLNKNNVWPLIFLPSLGALANGLLFGPLTIFLVYFLPFIWLGNYLQISIFSTYRQQSYLFGSSAAVLIKFLLLFVVANLYYRYQLVPVVFLTAMGVVQLATAALGAGLAYIVIQKLDKYE